MNDESCLKIEKHHKNAAPEMVGEHIINELFNIINSSMKYTYNYNKNRFRIFSKEFGSIERNLSKKHMEKR